VAGVIWGTVLTTFFSNLVVPGLYVFRTLAIDPRTYLKRTLSAPITGAAALIAATWLLQLFAPIASTSPAPWMRALPLIVHLSLGTLAYLAGYLLVPAGRGDLAELAARLRRR
jgi:hypothetical protein